jgi:hypothetical protein
LNIYLFVSMDITKAKFIVDQINSCSLAVRYNVINIIISEIGKQDITQNKDGVNLFIDILPERTIDQIYDIIKKAVEEDMLDLDE